MWVLSPFGYQLRTRPPRHCSSQVRLHNRYSWSSFVPAWVTDLGPLALKKQFTRRSRHVQAFTHTCPEYPGCTKSCLTDPGGGRCEQSSVKEAVQASDKGRELRNVTRATKQHEKQQEHNNRREHTCTNSKASARTITRITRNTHCLKPVCFPFPDPIPAEENPAQAVDFRNGSLMRQARNESNEGHPTQTQNEST